MIWLLLELREERGSGHGIHSLYRVNLKDKSELLQYNIRGIHIGEHANRKNKAEVLSSELFVIDSCC